MEDCPALNPGARTVDPPTQRRMPPRLPPHVLRVIVPSHQPSCSGLYMLVPDEHPNGYPLWQQYAPEAVHWLFCSSSGRWCIGGADVHRERFSRGAGYVAQTTPSGPSVFPHDCKTVWQYWDDANRTFQEDPAIRVTQVDMTPLDPTKPRILVTKRLNHLDVGDEPSIPPSGRSSLRAAAGESSFPPLEDSSLKVAEMQRTRTGSAQDLQDLLESINCKNSAVPPVIQVVSQNVERVLVGEYVLVAGARPNDQPLWHKQDGDMWLYGATDNRWYIAGSSVKLLQFFCATGEIYHAEEHLGRLPHQMHGCWGCCRQGIWVKDSGIHLRANWAISPGEQDVICC